MITLNGTLQVNTQGLLLNCSLGRFIVNDARLKKLSAGKHDGFFEIQRIEPTVYQKSSQIQLGLLAVLKSFALKTASETMTASLNSQLDMFSENVMVEEPIVDDAFSEADTEPPQEDSVSADAATEIINPILEQNPLLTVDNSDLPDEIELDPTLPRDQLRQSITRLQSQGYRFEKNRQLWLKSA